MLRVICLLLKGLLLRMEMEGMVAVFIYPRRRLFFSTNFNMCKGTRGGALFLGNNASLNNVDFIQNTGETGGAIYANNIIELEIKSSNILENLAAVSPAFHFEKISWLEMDGLLFSENYCSNADKTCLGVVSIVSSVGGKLTDTQFSENKMRCLYLQDIYSYEISDMDISENTSPTSTISLEKCGSSSGKVSFSEISAVSNHGEISGGFEFISSSAQISNSSIMDNTGSGKGPGMISKNSSITIVETLFQNNTSLRKGYTDFYCDVLSRELGSCQECCTKFRCEVCLGACVRNSTSDLCYNQFITFADISSCVSCPYKSVPITTEWIIILSVPLVLVLISFIGIAFWCCQSEETYSVIQ
eukprot:TRINITY_DN3867_c0_g1_i2.p1 TRINITY_DN3867_c0_g1~~TRINITY_DN3867_c0_g1_i2.p1  ORF type:complete len:359 (+),score=46.66 TRINITY_DN3867_c0_g1_i2:140-1216(+)